MKKTFFLLFWLAFGALGALSQARERSEAPPSKLSDLQRFMTQQFQEVFGPGLKVHSVIQGLSKEILATGRFRRVECELSSFHFQDLRFDKAGFVFDHFWVDPKALKSWKLSVDKVGEVQSHLTFTLPSLEAKVASVEGRPMSLKPDVASQEIEVSSKASLFFLPFSCVTRTVLAWDGSSLWLKPRRVSWGSFGIPRWLYWALRGAFPVQPVLTMGQTWIPLNIQELHLSWDKVTLSTDW
jgi:hypothetical protein